MFWKRHRDGKQTHLGFDSSSAPHSVILGNLFNLSEPLFLHLENGGGVITYLPAQVSEEYSTEMPLGKHLAQ